MENSRANIAAARSVRLTVVLLAMAPTSALGQPLSPEERAIVDQRVGATTPHDDKIKVAPGDTFFGVKVVEVPANRVTKKPEELEALITGIVAPAGVVVHERVDEVTVEPNGPKTKVTFRYAIHVDPGTKKGGKVRFNLALVERTGLANTLVSDPNNITVEIGKNTAKADDLVADFWAFRTYRALAEEKIKGLEQRRVNGLSIKDGARLPPLDKVGPRIAAQAFEFDRDRRRIWVAHRHLIAGSQLPDAKLAALAKTLLDNLDKPDGELKGVPKIGGAAAPPPPPSDTAKVEKIETLQPTRIENAPGGGGGKTGTGGSIAPVGSYESGTESDEPETIPDPIAPSTEKPPPPPPPPGDAITNLPPGGPDEGLVVSSDDPFLERRRRVLTIPSYFRSLVLDDPNIAHGGGARLQYASAIFKGNEATAAALYYFAQASFTRFFGVELTVPTQLVNMELDRARTVYGLGNPLLAVKYRFHLPEVEGRKPAVTVRARWSMPISSPHTIPPTVEFKAEDFTRDAHFSDSYAFNVDHTAVGLGINSVWQYAFLLAQFQLYGDYFISTIGGVGSFLSFQYAASVGALPFGDIVGFFVEARATSTLIGAGRTELFTYLGARGRFLDIVEPGLWVALPIGSVADASGIQFGVELRLSYDMEDIVGSTQARRQTSILEGER